MSFFILLYDSLLYNPLLNMLVALYEFIPGQDFGVAVILLTLLVRLVLMPLFSLSIRTQFKMAELQPKLKELQAKLKENKEELTKATLGLYRKEGVNPFSGILVLLLQLPIFLALFHLFRSGLDGELALRLYPFIPVPAGIDTSFFGFFDLASSSLAVAVVAAVAQFFQAKTAIPPQQKSADAASQIQQRMLYIFPIVTFAILTSLPSAIGLYWITTSVFSIWQQRMMVGKKKP
ncbi:MAG: YidC/Oxa1 family membrane protein insertase [bacterium]|nr:YidC/Oxa1 family membrane protein insertase [bacterium]